MNSFKQQRSIFWNSLFSLNNFPSYLQPPDPVPHVLLYPASSVSTIVFHVGGIFKCSLWHLWSRGLHAETQMYKYYAVRASSCFTARQTYLQSNCLLCFQHIAEVWMTDCVQKVSIAVRPPAVHRSPQTWYFLW